MDRDFRIVFDAEGEDPAPTPEQLSEYARGGLEPRRAREVGRHLEKDWRARQLAEQLEETWFLLEAWSDQTPPEHAEARFSQALAREVEKEKFLTAPHILSAPRRRGPGSFFVPLTWAAALAVVVLSTFYAFNSMREPGELHRSSPGLIVKQDKQGGEPARLARADVPGAPMRVDAPEEKAILPPELERNYPRLAAKLAGLKREAQGLFRADSPRLSSLFVAEEAGVMFDPQSVALEMGSSPELKQAVAAVAAQMEQYVVRAPGDGPRSPNGDSKGDSGH